MPSPPAATDARGWAASAVRATGRRSATGRGPRRGSPWSAPPKPLRSVPTRSACPSASQNAAKARVVEPPPALLPDPAPRVERGGEHESQPPGDDAERDRAGPPSRGAGNEHRQGAEVQDRVEEDRADVEADHRQARPRERPVQAEQRLLPLRPEQAGAHRKTEPDRKRQQSERHETGRACDEPGNGHAASCAPCTTRRSVTSGSRPSGIAGPTCGT